MTTRELVREGMPIQLPSRVKTRVRMRLPRLGYQRKQRGVIANPVRGRLNALFFRLVDRYVHGLLGPRKAVLFAGLPDEVVELRPGTGANLRYYRCGTRLVAIEPTPHMHSALARAAMRRGVDLEIRAVGAEDTGLASGSADTGVCTLVLCTVPDPAAALAEVRRILRPGGRLVLIEHVAAPDGTALAGVQQLLRRGWQWAFEGCDLRRPNGALLTAAGSPLSTWSATGCAPCSYRSASRSPGWPWPEPASRGRGQRYE